MERFMKKLIAALSVFVASIMLPVSVFAATPQISIPVSTIVRGNEGSTHELARKTVESKYVGMTCDVNATAKNQSSVHPDNDLIVSSGTNKVILKNVERESNGTTVAEGKLTLSDKLIVNLKLGRDKVFSGGLDVNLHCVQPPVEVCRDGKVITVSKDVVRNTDTKAPCPVIPKDIQVCRDGNVVNIKEDERLESDTDAPCPIEPEVVPTPKELPKTGSGALALATVTGIFGTLGHAIVTKKRV